MSVSPTYVCVPSVCPVQVEASGASDPLELELHAVVSGQLGAGTQTWVLCRDSQCSSPLIHLSGPNLPTSYMSQALCKAPAPASLNPTQCSLWPCKTGVMFLKEKEGGPPKAP